MAYHKEIKKYRPVLKRAGFMVEEGISLSSKKNILLISPSDPEAKIECILGWEDGLVTHLKMRPNPCLQKIIAKNKNIEDIQKWIGEKLSLLFGQSNMPVPSWILPSPS